MEVGEVGRLAANHDVKASSSSSRLGAGGEMVIEGNAPHAVQSETSDF